MASPFTQQAFPAAADGPTVTVHGNDHHPDLPNSLNERPYPAAEGVRRWLELGPLDVDAIFAIAVFLVALAPRVSDLSVFLTPDELRWTCRLLSHAEVRP